MKGILVFSLFFLLCACSSTPKPMNTLPCQKISLPELDPLPIKKITKNSSAADVMKAYVASVYIQKEYINEIKYSIESAYN